MRAGCERREKPRVNGLTRSSKDVAELLIRGLFHYALGSVAFWRGAKHWCRAERHLMLARYYSTRPNDGELEAGGLHWDLAWIIPCRRKIKVGCAEKAALKLGAINRRAMERDEDLRRRARALPGLFGSDMRELNVPLFLTYPD